MVVTTVWYPGDPESQRVLIELLSGICRSCKRGLFQCCNNGAINGVTRWGGCMQLLSVSFDLARESDESQMPNIAL